MCKHYPIQSSGPESDCTLCLREKAKRYEEALKRIIRRTWELGDYLPRDVLEDILRIVTAALKGSIGP